MGDPGTPSGGGQVAHLRRATAHRRPAVPGGPVVLGRTGIPWRDLPSEFGRWDGVYNRLRRWEVSGTLRRLFEALTDAPDVGDGRRMFVDSTILRAHRHAAGSGKKWTADAEGLGRRRGGFGSKVLVAAADEDTLLAVDVVPGHAADAPLLVPLRDATLARSTSWWATRGSIRTSCGGRAWTGR